MDRQAHRPLAASPGPGGMPAENVLAEVFSCLVEHDARHQVRHHPLVELSLSSILLSATRCEIFCGELPVPITVFVQYACSTFHARHGNIAVYLFRFDTD